MIWLLKLGDHHIKNRVTVLDCSDFLQPKKIGTTEKALKKKHVAFQKSTVSKLNFSSKRLSLTEFNPTHRQPPVVEIRKKCLTFAVATPWRCLWCTQGRMWGGSIDSLIEISTENFAVEKWGKNPPNVGVFHQPNEGDQPKSSTYTQGWRKSPSKKNGSLLKLGFCRIDPDVFHKKTGDRVWLPMKTHIVSGWPNEQLI